METNRTGILMGRIDKLTTLQIKLSNLKDGIVFGGKLPQHVEEGLKNPEIQNKITEKIKRAERIKLQLAILVYEDVQ